MGVSLDQDTGAFEAPLRGHKRKAELIETEDTKKARSNWPLVHNESDISEHGSLDTISNDAHVESSAATPLTPLSSKASPRRPSDLYKIHHCPYEDCTKSFNRPAKLNQHLRSHTNSRPFVCPHAPCTKDFLRESHLKHHMKSAHSNVREYVCEWEGCGRSFITATRLRRHHTAHEGKKQFRCTVTDCGQMFRKHGTLQKHFIMVHEGGHPFICELLNQDGMKCGAGFNTEGHMKSHAGRVHNTKTFLCTICPSQDEASNQGQHLGRRETTFPTHAELQAHIDNEHPPTCAECGLRCTSKSGLKSHVEIIHGGLDTNERRTHVCPKPDCRRAFTKKGNLNAHIQISHAGKRFVCGVIDLKTLNHVEGWDGSNACGEATSSKRNLERHIRTVHLGLELPGKAKMKEKRNAPGDAAQHNQASTLTRLTGSGYEIESGRDICCLIQGCRHRFFRQYDLEIHLQSRHGLADLEIQAMFMEPKLYSRPTLQGAELFLTEEDIEAGRAFDTHFGNHIAVEGTGDALEAAALESGDFWPAGDSFQAAKPIDEWMQDEMDMQQLINEGYERHANEGHAADDVDMIDPSLRGEA